MKHLFRFNDPDFGFTYYLNIAQKYTDSKGILIAKPIEFEKVKEDYCALPANPTISLSKDDVQGLVDELWRAGFRPTDYGNHTDKEALKYHLSDMRKIASKFLKVEL